MTGASPSTALLLSTLAGACTLLGWAIAAARPTWPRGWFAGALWFAAAAMIAVSAGELLPSAYRAGLGTVTIGLWCALGAVCVLALTWIAGRFTFIGRRYRAGALIALAVGLHNIPEGAAPFATAVVAVGSGIVTTIAIALHNIPEGLAIAAPVLANGGRRSRAFWLTFAAGAAEVVGALLALAFFDYLTPARIGGLLAFVAGIMLVIAVAELAPAAWQMTRSSELSPVRDLEDLSAVGRQPGD